MTNKLRLAEIREEQKRLAHEVMAIHASFKGVRKNSPDQVALKLKLEEVLREGAALKAERSTLLHGTPKSDPNLVAVQARRELDVCRQQNNQLRSTIAGLEEKVARLESRLSAGAERRRAALLCLNGLLACEDEDMDEVEWERRMDRVVRDARTILSLEKAAVASAA